MDNSRGQLRKGPVQRLFTFNDYSRNIGLVLIVGLVFTAIFLISNTIKLKSWPEARNWYYELVGATNGFIRWHSLSRDAVGVLGAIIPIVVFEWNFIWIITSAIKSRTILSIYCI
ncbi:hypothetical protein [Lentibacillus cibarius]|uniref:hypothetical protein n=1 Tax=Lentibacillus cibarius TaxID=2583219 RepID=UPI001F2CC85C|nr:hypothetical protein [Lentibacillus cibarius]